MVLQRAPAVARIWGWAAPGATIEVLLTRRHAAKSRTPRLVVATAITTTARTVADDPQEVVWMVELEPQAAGVDFTLQVTATAGTESSSNSVNNVTITLTDIAFGDVYLCSGQSNMEMTVSMATNATAEVADSVHYPHLRLFTVARVASDAPLDDAQSKSPDYIWARSAPASVVVADGGGGGSGDWVVYSATCYFFGRDLYRHLNEKHNNNKKNDSAEGASTMIVPIGLVTSCWGGQTVEAFSSPQALQDGTCRGTRPGDSGGKPVSRRVIQSLRRPTNNSTPSPRYYDEPEKAMTMDSLDVMIESSVGPSRLWNAMIHPLLPMRLRGILWYQGESNAGDPTSYACRFPAMITDWRQQFFDSSSENLYFGYVQLAGYAPGGTTWANQRAAQDAALQLPNVGRAVAVDLADPTSPSGEIHSRRKQEVGRRLALVTGALAYQERNGFTGPELAGVQLNKPMAADSFSVRLSFVPGTADGLHLAGSAACTRCCNEPPFHVLNAHGTWNRVSKAIVVYDNELFLFTNATVTATTTIFGIRYAWESSPECTVYNRRGGPDDHMGLAAAPFEWCAYPSGHGKWTGDSCRTKAVVIE